MRHPIPLTLITLALVACGRPPTPEELAAQTSAEAESFWREAIATARITNTMKVRDELFTNIEGLERYPSSDRPTIPAASTTDDFFSDLKTFATRIFTEANVIERGGAQMTFRVSGVDICTPTKGTATASSSCIADVEKANLSVRAVAGTKGVDLTLLLNREIELFTFQVVKGESQAVTVDLGNAQKASEFVNATWGTNSPFRDLTFVGSGKVEVRVTKLGDSNFEATVSFLTDLSGTVTDDRGFSRSGSSPARTPAFEGRIDGPNFALTTNVNLGTSEYRGKWSDFFDYGDNTPMTWALSGLTFNASLIDNGPRSVSNIALGSGVSSLQYGGQVVGSIELNPSLGRQFAVDITSGSNGLAAFTARPGIEAALVMHLKTLPNTANTDPSLLDSTYVYSLTSSEKAPQVELVRATSVDDPAIKLTKGSLSLSSPTAGSPRLFNAVTCLTGRTTSLMPGENAMLDIFSSRGCP